MATAIAKEPALLLLDEPFSSVDQPRKHQLRKRFFDYLQQKGITLITATHDPDDILGYADDILVLEQGEVLAFGQTQTIYESPKNKTVASLFGLVNEIQFNNKNSPSVSS